MDGNDFRWKDRSKIIESYRKELAALKKEFEVLRRLLAETEEERREEEGQKKELVIQVQRLTESKNNLEAQLLSVKQNNVPNAQLNSLEKRLRITEDRLRRLHDCSATKLTDTEERLTTENAKLQAERKELTRRLQRLEESQRFVRLKYKDAKSDAGLETAVESVSIETNSFPSRSDVVDERTKAFMGEISTLQNTVTQLTENLDDVTQQKQTIQELKDKVIHDLLVEKHSLSAKMECAEDKLVAIEVENEALRNALQTVPDSMPTPTINADREVILNDKIEGLKMEVLTFRAAASSHQRARQQLEAELSSLRSVEESKVAAFEEALEEATEMRRELMVGESRDRKQMRQIDELQLKVESHESNIRLWRQRYESVAEEKSQIQQQHSILIRQLTEHKNLVEELIQKLDRKEEELEQMRRDAEDIKVDKDSQTRTIDALNKEITESNQQLKSKMIACDILEARVSRLQSDLHQREQLISQRILRSLSHGTKMAPVASSSGRIVTPEVRTESGLLAEFSARILKLEEEKNRLQCSAEAKDEAIEKIVRENAQLRTDERRLRQDLSKEHSRMSKLTCERIDLLRRLQVRTDIQQDDPRSDPGLGLPTAKYLSNDLVTTRQSQDRRHGYDSIRPNEKVIIMDRLAPVLTDEATDFGNECRLERSTVEKEETSFKDVVGQKEQEVNLMRSTIESLQQQVRHLTTVNEMIEKKLISSDTEKEKGGEAEFHLVQGRMRLQAIETEAVRRQLVDIQEAHHKEKLAIQRDVEALYQKLQDRDATIARLEDDLSGAVRNLETHHSTQMNALIQQKEQLERELQHERMEADDHKESLRLKNLQIEAHTKLNADLTTETKEESKVKVDHLPTDLTAATEKMAALESRLNMKTNECRHLESLLDQNRESCQSDQLKIEKQKMRSAMDELRESHLQYLKLWDQTRNDLEERLQAAVSGQCSSDHWVRYQSDVEEKEQNRQIPQESNTRLNDRSSQDLLCVERTRRYGAEKKAATLFRLLQDIRNRKFGFDSGLVAVQRKLNQTEMELETEREKNRKLRDEQTKRYKATDIGENYILSLHERIAELEAELTSSRRQCESCQEDALVKQKSFQKELQVQWDAFDEERAQLLMRTQQVSLEMENLRVHLSEVDRERTVLKEELDCMDKDLREAHNRIDEMEHSLNNEIEENEDLGHRNKNLELLAVQLRSRLEDDSDVELARAEVTRNIRELSRRMERQMEARQKLDIQLREADSRQLQEFRTRMMALEATLHQEQSMHAVTRAELASVKEDNERLRQQLKSTRNQLISAVEPARSKSRLEEINEIIARSQIRAQQIIASGGATMRGTEAASLIMGSDTNRSTRVNSSFVLSTTTLQSKVIGSTNANQNREEPDYDA